MKEFRRNSDLKSSNGSVPRRSNLSTQATPPQPANEQLYLPHECTVRNDVCKRKSCPRVPSDRCLCLHRPYVSSRRYQNHLGHQIAILDGSCSVVTKIKLSKRRLMIESVFLDLYKHNDLEKRPLSLVLQIKIALIFFESIVI